MFIDEDDDYEPEIFYGFGSAHYVSDDVPDDFTPMNPIGFIHWPRSPEPGKSNRAGRDLQQQWESFRKQVAKRLERQVTNR